MAAAFPEFFWIAVLGVIVSFIMAFGIGANDVANAFGSSVAAKSLSLGKAIVVASIFEFAGSVLLGQSVASTIKDGVIDSEYYADQPEVLMFGMLNALILASIWLIAATALELPISTTHTIVAAIIGFSLAAEGFQSIDWKTAGKIFISWVAAPTFAGTISCIFFTAIKKLVMGASNTFERAMNVYPVVIFIGITINIAFILLKGKKRITEKNSIEKYVELVVLPASLGAGFLSAIIFQFVVGPWLRRKVVKDHDEYEARAAEHKARLAEHQAEEIGSDEKVNRKNLESEDDDDVEASPKGGEEKDKFEAEAKKGSTRSSKRGSLGDSVHEAWNRFAESTFRQDLQTLSLSESNRASEIWDAAAKHDPKTERLFSYLQVFTACMTSFAHGANDVANAIAPASAIIQIYKTGEIESKSEVPKWILAMGGFGIILGFVLYGYKIIKAVGYKLTAITPSRGFCIELATSLAVLIASYLGIPVSSTQCLVGATVGAGVASGGLKEVQWLYFARVTFGWVATFFITVLTSAAFMAFCVYSPSLVPQQ